ncbi:MAG: ribosome silencing factor [Puniceicoccaceae bacterium]
MPSSLKNEQLPAPVLACCEALLDKKAIDLTVIDVKGVSTITDYYVIATGASSPQLRAMAQNAKSTLKESSEATGMIDGDPASGWVVLDAYAFVVHLFLPDTRDQYALEALWKDRPSVTIA